MARPAPRTARPCPDLDLIISSTSSRRRSRQDGQLLAKEIDLAHEATHHPMPTKLGMDTVKTSVSGFRMPGLDPTAMASKAFDDKGGGGSYQNETYFFILIEIAVINIF